jgi:hypothetical protein
VRPEGLGDICKEEAVFGTNVLPPSSRSKSKPFKKLEQTGGRLSLFSSSVLSLLCLIFDNEDGGDMSLRNVDQSPNITVLQLKRAVLFSLGVFQRYNAVISLPLCL